MHDTDAILDATTAAIPPLLSAMDALAFMGRYADPATLPELITAVTDLQPPLVESMATFAEITWPEHLSGFVEAVTGAAQSTLQAVEIIASAQHQSQPMMAAYRAMGHHSKALESLYPLSYGLPPVSRFYLEPDARDDATLLAKLAAAEAVRAEVGVMHADNPVDQRGGFSLYVPEYFAGESLPLIIALHGGSGHGRRFLWSWVRAARSRGAVVISATSDDRTWSLHNPEAESQRLAQLVAYAQEHWQTDPQRVVLTGMSDGGTFSYVCGLVDSPFTHLAPCSASFHPMLAETADPQRLQDLPIYLVHGANDWMFPIEVARTAKATLQAAGARVSYHEVNDLAHTYPLEHSARIIDWVNGELFTNESNTT